MKKLLMLVVVAAIGCTNDAQAEDQKRGAVSQMDRLIEALIQQESSGRDHAIGDKKFDPDRRAYGCLQIRKTCIDDVNRRYGTTYTAKDCLGNRELSKWVCVMYIQMYATQERLGHKPTLQDMARIWNGGPNGWKRKATLKYWSQVQTRL